MEYLFAFLENAKNTRRVILVEGDKKGERADIAMKIEYFPARTISDTTEAK